MQVTEKGQVTIPKDVRLAAGVVPGSEVAITFEAGRIVIQKLAGAKKPDRRAQLQRAAAKAQKSLSSHFQQMSAEAIMEFMRPPEKA